MTWAEDIVAWLDDMPARQRTALLARFHGRGRNSDSTTLYMIAEAYKERDDQLAPSGAAVVMMRRLLLADCWMGGLADVVDTLPEGVLRRALVACLDEFGGPAHPYVRRNRLARLNKRNPGVGW